MRLHRIKWKPKADRLRAIALLSNAGVQIIDYEGINVWRLKWEE